MSEKNIKIALESLENIWNVKIQTLGVPWLIYTQYVFYEY